MSVDEDPDIQLNVPVHPIYEELCCPICFNPIRDCYITPCGHNFCSECILECVNRKHQCPCCNKAVVRDQLIKNHHFDKLLAIVEAKKTEASKAYFESLINSSQASSGSSSGAHDTSTPPPPRKLSPIEEIFHKHMKKSLLAYEEYYKELTLKYQNTQKTMRADYAGRMADTKQNFEMQIRAITESSSSSSSTSTPAHLQALMQHTLQELTMECERALAHLQKSFDDSSSSLLHAYETYMKDAIPPPAFLPVTVSIVIENRDITMPNLVVRPTDCAVDVKATIADRLRELGNPLTAWAPENVLVLRSAIKGKSEDVPLLDEHRPVLQYQPAPGSQIVVTGKLMLASDKPKACFTVTYDKSNTQTVDYYSCKDCKFNWICKVCAENCHKGHQVAIYLPNHKPTWACCYDPKNNKCKIENNKTKK